MADPMEEKTLDQWLYELQAPDRKFTPDDLRVLRDVLALRKRTGREWAQAVAIKERVTGPQAPPPDSDPVTQDEAPLAYLVGMNDLLYRLRDLTQDMQDRLQRLEMFAEDILPGYAAHAERVSRKQEQQRQAALAPPNGVPHAV